MNKYKSYKYYNKYNKLLLDNQLIGGRYVLPDGINREIDIAVTRRNYPYSFSSLERIVTLIVRAIKDYYIAAGVGNFQPEYDEQLFILTELIKRAFNLQNIDTLKLLNINCYDVISEILEGLKRTIIENIHGRTLESLDTNNIRNTLNDITQSFINDNNQLYIDCMNTIDTRLTGEAQ